MMSKTDKLCEMIGVLFRAGYTADEITELWGFTGEKVQDIVKE